MSGNPHRLAEAAINITNGLTENAVTESFASGKAEIKRELAKEKRRSNNTGTPTPIRLGAGRPAGAGGQSAATTAMKKFRADYDKLEDRNAHGEAALLLAKFMGHSRAVKCIELVNKIHETEGSIPYPIQQYRDQWSQRLWADFDKNYPNERSIKEKTMTEAEKILEASQVALERAGVVVESAMKAAMEDWLEALPKPAVKEFFGVRKKFPNPKDRKTVDAKNLEILKKYKVKPLIGDPSHRESLGALSCCLDMLVGGQGESAEKQGDTLAEGKAIKIGRLTFESFTNGSISGWWVKHIPVVQGQGVWKPNTLGWIEERKSTKTSVIPSFLWLEKGNGEENTKALIVWPKGSAPVAGANIVVASNPGTGGLLQAVAKWIRERRPDLVKEETVEPKLTEAQKIIEASQVALGRAGVLSEEKQAPKITEKMIRDDMGLGSQDIGKGAMQILRSGWCANCDKEWYAVVFLAKNRVWWAEISGLDQHATYKNMGKRSLHNAALAKFDAPGKWKDTTGQKYTPVTN